MPIFSGRSRAIFILRRSRSDTAIMLTSQENLFCIFYERYLACVFSDLR